MPREILPQGYLAHLEFEPAAIRTLEPIEMIAEKVRATYQRAKVRDLYDLHRFASTPFDGRLLRRLAVLKLWQAGDPFDPEAFFERIRGGRYEWEDLRRLVRRTERLEAEQILSSVESRFAVLRELTDLEHALISDAKSGWNEPLADKLREEIAELAGGSTA